MTDHDAERGTLEPADATAGVERPEDEELADPRAQAGIRSDTGTSASAPKEEALSGPEATPGPERSPLGAGEDAGRGHLGTATTGGTGSPEAGSG